MQIKNFIKFILGSVCNRSGASSVSSFADKFKSASTLSLIDSFNSQVGNRGFNSARAAHDSALIDEIKHRGIDVSAVCTGDSISFARRVKLVDNRLVIAE